VFWKKRKQERSRTFTGHEITGIVDDIASKLELKEGEKVLGGALPIHIGVREDFDPTHSFSCGSARDKVKMRRLGAFIQTNMRLIFKRLEEDGISRTILNVPLEGVYTVEVGGVEEKHSEVCCEAGSFEFKGFNNERIYRIAEGLQALCDNARQVEREALFRSIETLSRVRALVCGFFPSRFGQTLSPAARAGSSAAM
jgi:hypothetical protein